MANEWEEPPLGLEPVEEQPVSLARTAKNTYDAEAAEMTEVTESKETTEITFVLNQSQVGVRSHAMREYWKQRRRTSQHQNRRATIPHRPRQLLPNKPSNPDHSADMEEPEYGLQQQHQPRHHHSDIYRWHADRPTAAHDGIPPQVLTGANHALANCRLDPFDRFPVKLTAQHHKLLHHWLSSHATMMFDELPMASFNPMRDVWFPLDLSNAASFNAIMAHAAAHLARLHGIKYSNEAFKYKTEALRIVRIWMQDQSRALSDEVFAAVIRLLTFERYWGTEAEWRVHRDGLQHMIEARGGIASLQSNWRLELVAYLISLMARPSWFDSSNNIFELSQETMAPSVHPLGSGENLRRVRCLWLVSFIQDMNTFLFNSVELRNRGLQQYPGVQDAILLLHAEMKRHALTLHDREEACSPIEFTRLSCLFFISVLLQTPTRRPSLSVGGSHSSVSGATPASNNNTPPGPSNDLILMDTVLQSWNVWPGSVEDLHNLLFNNFTELPNSVQKTNYVLQMTNVLASLSSEARRGVEKCLLRILCQAGGSDEYGNEILSSSEDDWTPDGLLSSLRGL